MSAAHPIVLFLYIIPLTPHFKRLEVYKLTPGSAAPLLGGEGVGSYFSRDTSPEWLFIAEMLRGGGGFLPRDS